MIKPIFFSSSFIQWITTAKSWYDGHVSFSLSPAFTLISFLRVCLSINFTGSWVGLVFVAAVVFVLP